MVSNYLLIGAAQQSFIHHPAESASSELFNLFLPNRAFQYFYIAGQWIKLYTFG